MCARAVPPTMTLFEPTEVWRAYEAAASSQPLAADMLTCATCGTIADSIAQFSERAVGDASSMLTDVRRTARFGIFGFFDGAVAHGWFHALDAAVGDDGTTGQTLVKVAYDALLYTPCWCLWFITAFALLEGKSLRDIPRMVKNDFGELYQGNLGFFLPLTGIIYGVVPRNQRVLAEELANLVYTTFVSLWSHARDQDEPALAEVE